MNKCKEPYVAKARKWRNEQGAAASSGVRRAVSCDRDHQRRQPMLLVERHAAVQPRLPADAQVESARARREQPAHERVAARAPPAPRVPLEQPVHAPLGRARQQGAQAGQQHQRDEGGERRGARVLEQGGGRSAAVAVPVKGDVRMTGKGRGMVCFGGDSDGGSGTRSRTGRSGRRSWRWRSTGATEKRRQRALW